ncbi:MAG: M20/M25/M40 family metallo-hydrolase [Gemmatimonadetes bacterium]|nr:M20/M25/M40 family metallo-hydrolase [Gemmatimonadota bacterium]NNM04145.1 M20/M25/M40 family metallo-hydrolase [Gemmatimonadota bacterium]
MRPSPTRARARSNPFPHKSLAPGAQNLLLLALPLVGLLIGPSITGAQEERYDREVADLLSGVAVQEAMREIVALDAWTQEKLVALTEIPAPPFMEEERAKAFAQMLENVGADSVRMDGVGNVLAFRRGRVGNRTVVLGAHMDTVFPEGTDVTVKARGDTLFAPGIGDDTRGLAVVLTVLRAMEDVGIRTDADLVFLGSVGEEGLGDLRGVKHFFAEDGRDTDAFVEVDGGGISSIVNKGLGSIRYRVTFRGDGGHSWGAFGLVNPVHALGRAIREFAVVADGLTLDGPRTSFNVGRIGGGTSINSVPFEAWMEVDMRSESPSSLDSISAAFRRAAQVAAAEEDRFARDGSSIELEVEQIGLRPSGEVDPSTPLVQRAMAVTRSFGESPYLSRSSTNSNIPISLGIPAITIGRGGAGGENHSPGEWWVNEDGYKAIQRALLIVLAEAGISGEG